jgi:hypothetical protein
LASLFALGWWRRGGARPLQIFFFIVSIFFDREKKISSVSRLPSAHNTLF